MVTWLSPLQAHEQLRKRLAEVVASESRLLAQREELQAQSEELKLGVEDLRAQLDEAARQREM